MSTLNDFTLDTGVLEPRPAETPAAKSTATSAVEATIPAPRLDPNRVMVVIPAYNEERFIGSVVLKARRFAQTVLVVDDGSNDATAQVAADAGAIVFSHDENRGKGAALNTAFQVARNYDPEVLVALDADGQHRPEELARVVAPVTSGQADVVIGSRYLRKDSQVPRGRAWSHRAFNLLNRLASGVPVGDTQSGYRAFSPRAVEAIAFSSRGFEVESEMQFLAHELGLKVLEVPVTILYLDKPKRSAVAQGLSVLNGVLHLTGQYRPLLFLGVPGAVLLLLGFAWAAYVVEIFRRTTQLAVGYTLLSLLLAILGMILLSTGMILHSVRGLLTDLLSKSRPH